MISEDRLRQVESRLPATAVTTVTLVVPHVLEFALAPEYLNAGLFPRQGTMLKVICCAPELFTDFDRMVVEQWAAGFSVVDRDDGTAGYAGIRFRSAGAVRLMLLGPVQSEPGLSRW